MQNITCVYIYILVYIYIYTFTFLLQCSFYVYCSNEVLFVKKLLFVYEEICFVVWSLYFCYCERKEPSTSLAFSFPFKC